MPDRRLIYYGTDQALEVEGPLGGEFAVADDQLRELIFQQPRERRPLEWEVMLYCTENNGPFEERVPRCVLWGVDAWGHGDFQHTPRFSAAFPGGATEPLAASGTRFRFTARQFRVSLRRFTGGPMRFRCTAQPVIGNSVPQCVPPASSQTVGVITIPCFPIGAREFRLYSPDPLKNVNLHTLDSASTIIEVRPVTDFADWTPINAEAFAWSPATLGLNTITAVYR